MCQLPDSTRIHPSSSHREEGSCDDRELDSGMRSHECDLAWDKTPGPWRHGGVALTDARTELNLWYEWYTM
jgi:hypothetical protein